jgi:hypothetical protein
MRRLPLLPLLGLAVGLLPALSGCGLFHRRPLVLCTDRPELAAFVEQFNARQPDLRVHLRYQPAPEEALHRDQGVDLLISTRLAGSGEARALEALEDLFRGGRLERAEFYAPLLAAGAPERRQVLLPLSFCLPAVLFLPYNLTEPPPNLGLPLDFLRRSAGAYNQRVRDALVREGFSPLWDPEFLLAAAELAGARFREEAAGSVEWEAAALEQAIAYLRDWVQTTNGGIQAEQAFAGKYLYLPPGRLLDEKRIQFYLLRSCDLLRALEEQKEEADFRWLAGPEKILVDEEILFAGIPRSCRRKAQAKSFLLWLFQSETQTRLLEVGRRQRLGVFGIAGGFSGLKAVNELAFPQYYPRLIGRIPPEELLQVPGPLPQAWPEIKAQVLVPWLREAVISTSTPADLEERLKAARLARSRKPAY